MRATDLTSVTLALTDGSCDMDDEVIDGGPGWHMDPETLLPVLDDEATFRAAHADDPAVDVLVALWSGRPDDAALLLAPLLAVEPSRLRWQALSADIARDRGDPAQAIATLERLRDRYLGTPREAVLVQHLGKAHFAAGQPRAAAGCFRRALALRTAAWADAALIASSRRAYERALRAVEPTTG